MADVACFCGCNFSFEGSARACPRCGEFASLTGGRAPGPTGFDQADEVLVFIKDIWQNGQPRQYWPELDETGSLAAIDELAGRVGNARQRR